MNRPPPAHAHDVALPGHSATTAILERMSALQAAGHDVYRLGFGQTPFPVPEVVVDALREHATVGGYLPVAGLPALRQAVADHARRAIAAQRQADDVLIGPGSKMLMFLLQLVLDGELLLPTPCWVSYAPQARLLGRRVRLLPTTAADDWKLDPDVLEAACRARTTGSRILLLNYPSNPQGGVYDPPHLEALAGVARQHGLLVLADEIYGELHHAGEHVSIARYYGEGTVVSGGLSKWCGAGGWRLGTFVFPPELERLREAMAGAASETYTSASAPVQHAAARAYAGGAAIEAYLQGSRRVLAALGRWAQARLGEAEVACPEPRGAFYLWADFTAHQTRLAGRGIETADALAERLLAETGVALLPGTAFGRPPTELAARIAYVDFDGALALKAADPAGALPDERFLRDCCPRVVEAVRRTGTWLGVTA